MNAADDQLLTGRDPCEGAIQVIDSGWDQLRMTLLTIRLKKFADINTVNAIRSIIYPEHRYNGFSGAFNYEKDMLIEYAIKGGLISCLFCCALTPLFLYIVSVKASWLSLHESLKDDYKPIQYAKYLFLMAFQLGSAWAIGNAIDDRFLQVVFAGAAADQQNVHMVDNFLFCLLIMLLAPVINLSFTAFGFTQRFKLRHDLRVEGDREESDLLSVNENISARLITQVNQIHDWMLSMSRQKKTWGNARYVYQYAKERSHRSDGQFKMADNSSWRTIQVGGPTRIRVVSLIVIGTMVSFRVFRMI